MRRPVVSSPALLNVGGFTRGRSPLVGGAARSWRRGGNSPAPAFPLGETGKGDIKFPAAAGAFCLLPSPNTPCFHSHSLRSEALPCRLVFSFSDRVLPSLYRTETSRCRKASFHRDVAVTRTRRLGCKKLVDPSGCLSEPLLSAAVTQRLVDFTRYP